MEIDVRGVDWIPVAQDRILWRDLLYTVMKLWVFKVGGGDIFTSCAYICYQLFKEGSAVWS
jgi:hypothetical protein